MLDDEGEDETDMVAFALLHDGEECNRHIGIPDFDRHSTGRNPSMKFASSFLNS